MSRRYLGLSRTRRMATVTHGTVRIAAFTTVRRAERFIAEREKTDPKGVARGDYGIDASERADYEYQRLRGRKGKAPRRYSGDGKNA
jgi:hypothetical protein